MAGSSPPQGLETPRPPAPGLRQRRLLLAALIVAAVGLDFATGRLEGGAQAPMPLDSTPRFSGLALGGLQGIDSATLPVEYRFARGESLDRVLRRFGLPPAQVQAAGVAAAEHLDPRRMRAGDTYAALFEDGRRLEGFAFTRAGEGQVKLHLVDGQWHGRFVPFKRHYRTGLVVGQLDGLLQESIERCGGHPHLAYHMSDVLQWDLDFNRDLRPGDRFRVVYELIGFDLEPERVSSVLALSYETRGRRFEAYRFDGGFYDAQGQPLRKQFLRSPLPYSRVTSRFSHRRFHPVLKVHRPHLGVDYGAPTGTPIRSTAAGTIDFVGWDKGGGKMVRIRHPNGYLTAYLHLSRYARGIGRGARVEQGQVVGYVGATGLATGPHLDYRVRHHGNWIDPLSMRNNPAPPIPEQDRPRFVALRDHLRRQLLEPVADQAQASASPVRSRPRHREG